MSHKLRTTLYGFVLAMTLMETGLAFPAAFISGFSDLMLFFGMITGAFSLITWIWTSVLLSYNNRPRSSHVLTRTSVHFYSFASFCIILLVMAILIFSQLPTQCNFKRDSDGEAGWWCASTAWVASFALISSILSGVTAYFIQKQSNGMSSHVCSGDSEYYNELGLTSAS